MTEQSTLTPRLRPELAPPPPEPQISISVAGKERWRRRLARRVAGWAGVLLIVYWLAAFVVTHLPMPKAQGEPFPNIPHADKLVHVSIYTGLALLLSVWFGVRKRITGAMVVAALVLIVLTGYAAIDEVSQGPLGRSPDIRDWCADVAGVHFGLFGFFALRRWVRS